MGAVGLTLVGGSEGGRPPSVTLRSLPIGEARLMLAGRPTAQMLLRWHPQYPTSHTLDALALVFGAYAAIGTALTEEPDWWTWQIVVTPGGSSGPAPPRRRLAAFSLVEIRPGIPTLLAAEAGGRYAPAQTAPSSAWRAIHLDDAGPSTNLRAQPLVADDVVVGDVGFHGPPTPERPRTVEIGYSVVPAWRGRGVGTRGCALILQRAWAAGADRVVAEAAPDNLASAEVLRRNGFQRGDAETFAITRPAR